MSDDIWKDWKGSDLSDLWSVVSVLLEQLTKRKTSARQNSVTLFSTRSVEYEVKCSPPGRRVLLNARKISIFVSIFIQYDKPF
jgi:hypothetical protein